MHAVENISFDLFQGETLSIVGESGCGKSTTGRSVTRLIEPATGDIVVDGHDVMRLDRARLRTMRRNIQMVFQDPFASLNPRMTVGAALADPYLEHRLGTAKQARDKAADLLEKVGLKADVMRRFPHEFSGGQRQRIAIARALVLKPRFVVLDEPTSALDVSVQAQVVELLRALQQRHRLAYLFISHDLRVVRAMAHRIIVLKDGRVVEEGEAEQILAAPRESYTRALMAAAFDLRATGHAEAVRA